LSEAGARFVAENPEPRDLDGAGESEDHIVSTSARGAGPLGISRQFDVNLLAEEAEHFFERLEQLSQDLASLLAVDPVYGAIAVGMAAMAVAVAHRRLQ